MLLVGSWLLSVGVAVVLIRLDPGRHVDSVMSSTNHMLHFLPPIRTLEFASGVALGHLGVVTDGARGRCTAALHALALAVGLVVARPPFWPAPALLVGYGGLLPLCWALIWCVAFARASSPALLRASRALGRSSFAVYVLHDPLLRVVNIPLHRGWVGTHGALVLAAWFVLLIPVSLLTDRWFVTPLARRLRTAGMRRPSGAGPTTGELPSFAAGPASIHGRSSGAGRAVR
jgi:peptidoglycan/LPS O-acetylase OafA/YrhL